MPINRQWTKVRVIVWEMDRFLGRKEFDRYEFDWRQQAEDFVKEHNSHNTGPTPEWYTYAELID